MSSPHAHKGDSPAHPYDGKLTEPRRQDDARLVRALAIKLRPPFGDSSGADRPAANESFCRLTLRELGPVKQRCGQKRKTPHQ